MTRSLLLSLILVLFLPAAAVAEELGLLPDPLTRAEAGLRGPASSLRTSTELFINGTSSLNNYEELFHFNAAGQLTAVELYERGMLAMIRRYERQQQGNLLVIRHLENRALDRRRQELEERHTWYCALNPAGRILSIERRNHNGTLDGRSLLEYDSNGRITVERHLDPEGQTVRLRLSNFDGPARSEDRIFDIPNRRITEFTPPEEIQQVEYDAQGRRIRALITPATGLPYEERHTYDAAGRLIRKEASRQGIVFEETAWSFNEYGDLARMELIARQDTGRVQEFEYEYDLQGNWIMRKMTEMTRVLGEAHHKRTEITRREIRYTP